MEPINKLGDGGAQTAAAERAMTHLTLDGEVIDLSDLSDQERAHFVRFYAAYRAGGRSGPILWSWSQAQRIRWCARPAGE